MLATLNLRLYCMGDAGAEEAIGEKELGKEEYDDPEEESEIDDRADEPQLEKMESVF